MKKNNKTTIREISRLSGYSVTTVSRVLGKSELVKEDTKEKILKIIEDQSFSPNMIARSLKTKKTNTIGLILGDIENPFYSRVAKGVIDTAEQRNYNVILCNSNYDTKLEEKSIETLLNRQVDGFLLTTVKLKHTTIDDLKYRGVPYVLIDYKLDLPGVSYIVNDDYHGGKIAAEYLVSLGHKHIAFFGNEKLLSFKKRFDGFKEILNKYGISVNEYLIDDINDITEINNSIRNLVNAKEKFTALFAVNDFLAIKAVENFIALGLKVPRDISIIGYDNISISSMLRVPLTTINQPKYKTGKLAAELLLDMLESKEGVEDKKLVLKPELIIRQSCIEI
ncbi:MAG: LacI family DNA-binding transcriptional regulator [Candidatus Humimicrobiaceae bacterium]